MGIPYFKDLRLLPQVPDLLPEGEEFAATAPIDADTVAAVCRAGYMPMTFGERGPEVLLVKCHLERMVLELPNLHVPRNTRRYARGLSITVDQDVPGVIRMMQRCHAHSWITAALGRALLELHEQPREGVRVHSVEVYETDPSDRPADPSPGPVAAELGYRVGGVYTSLTGCHYRNGSGWVQMVGLGRILRDLGVLFWDLGMEMPYKRRIGAGPQDRATFLARYRAAVERPASEMPPPATHWNARDLVDRARDG